MEKIQAWSFLIPPAWGSEDYNGFRQWVIQTVLPSNGPLTAFEKQHISSQAGGYGEISMSTLHSTWSQSPLIAQNAPAAPKFAFSEHLACVQPAPQASQRNITDWMAQKYQHQAAWGWQVHLPDVLLGETNQWAARWLHHQPADHSDVTAP